MYPGNDKSVGVGSGLWKFKISNQISWLGQRYGVAACKTSPGNFGRYPLNPLTPAKVGYILLASRVGG